MTSDSATHETTEIENSITGYLQWLRVDKQASPNSVKAAEHDLRLFADDCAKAQLQTLAAIDVHVIRRHIARLHRDGRKPRSVARMLSSIRSWLRHEVELGHLHANPAHSVRAPKGRSELPKTVEAEALNAALDRGARATGNDPWRLRDQAIMELFYSCGLRLSELQGLNAPVGSTPLELRVLGKGNRERIVPVGSKARQALEKWLRQRTAHAAAGETALFISRRGRRLSHRGIQSRVDHWARSVDLPGHLHPHRFRHSFASHLLSDGGQLRPVQELLGHANITTTQIYTALDWKRLAQVYDSAHPRAHRKGVMQKPPSSNSD